MLFDGKMSYPHKELTHEIADPGTVFSPNPKRTTPPSQRWYCITKE